MQEARRSKALVLSKATLFKRRLEGNPTVVQPVHNRCHRGEDKANRYVTFFCISTVSSVFRLPSRRLQVSSAVQ